MSPLECSDPYLTIQWILKVDIDDVLELNFVDLFKAEQNTPAYLAKQVRFEPCTLPYWLTINIPRAHIAK